MRKEWKFAGENENVLKYAVFCTTIILLCRKYTTYRSEHLRKEESNTIDSTKYLKLPFTFWNTGNGKYTTVMFHFNVSILICHTTHTHTHIHSIYSETSSNKMKNKYRQKKKIRKGITQHQIVLYIIFHSGFWWKWEKMFGIYE